MPTTHRHPIFARVYTRLSRAADEAGAEKHRRRLLEGLSGRVLEVGAGHGLNFAHYPSTVTHLTAIEPEPHLRSLAIRAAVAAPIEVEVLNGVAEALPAPDGTLDAVVTSLVLCSVADQATVLREISRVLRHGGELRFYEHVVATQPGWARLQRVLDSTVYPSLGAGCHLARDTQAAIRAAGFEIEFDERLDTEGSRIMSAIPHVLGIARRT